MVITSDEIFKRTHKFIMFPGRMAVWVERGLYSVRLETVGWGDVVFR